MLEVLLGMDFFRCLGNLVLVAFYEGEYFSIPTAANENSIKASWLIILGVRNDGLGVTFYTCSIWNMGSYTMGTCFGAVLEVFMSALRFSFNFFASSLFSCLVSLSFLEFLFLTLLWTPSESDIGGKIFATFRICYFCGWLGWYDTWYVVACHARMHPRCGPYVGTRGWRRQGLCTVLLLCF